MKDGTKISDLSEFEQAQFKKAADEAQERGQRDWDRFCDKTLIHYPDMESPELQFFYAAEHLLQTPGIFIRDWNYYTESVTNCMLDSNHSGYETIGADDYDLGLPKTVLEALGMESEA